MRVLMVDDSAPVRRSLRDTLATAFPAATFGEAGTAAEGLALLQRQDWDLALLDLSLPDGGGLAAVNTFRRLRPRLPLVVLSMHPASQYAAAVEAAGAVYLPKGSDPETIVATVRGATGTAAAGDRGHEPEARRLGRALHDDVGQLLTAMKINLRLAAASNDLEEMRGRTLQAVGLVDQAICSVRRLVTRLVPPLLDELGLVAACQALVAGLQGDAGLGNGTVIALEAPTLEGRRLDPELETAAFQIVEEALSNVVRHARAHTAAVSLRRQNGGLLIQVRDDGGGFDVAARAAEREHCGLLGIRERARALGGRCEVRSSAGGTELLVHLPLPDAVAPEARP